MWIKVKIDIERGKNLILTTRMKLKTDNEDDVSNLIQTRRWIKFKTNKKKDG